MKHGRTVFVAVLYFSPFLPKKEYTNNRGHENVKNAPSRDRICSADGFRLTYLDLFSSCETVLFFSRSRKNSS